MRRTTLKPEQGDGSTIFFDFLGPFSLALNVDRGLVVVSVLGRSAR